MPRVALLSTSDTDLLSARSSGADYALANPSRLDVATELAALLDGADLVDRPDPRARRGSWQDGLDAVRARAADGGARRRAGAGRRVDAAVHRADRGGRAGAPLPGRGRAGEPRAAARVLSATPCCSPARVSSRRPSCPAWGAAGPAAQPDGRPVGPRIGILYLPGPAGVREHRVRRTRWPTPSTPAGRRGRRCRSSASSLRGAPADLLDELGTLDALVVTVLAAGGTKPATATAGGDDEAWDVTRPGRAGHPDPAGTVPDLVPARPGPTPTRACRRWTWPPRWRCRSSTAGSSPCRSPSRRPTPTGCRTTCADPERCARVAEIAVSHARLRHIPPARAQDRDRAVGLPDEALPDRQRGRPGHAGVGDPAAAGDARRPATTSGESGEHCPDWHRWSRSRARSRTPPPATR